MTDESKAILIDAELKKPAPLRILTNPEGDTVTIEGTQYDGYLFRNMGCDFPGNVGQVLRVVKKANGVVTVQRVTEQEQANPPPSKDEVRMLRMALRDFVEYIVPPHLNERPELPAYVDAMVKRGEQVLADTERHDYRSGQRSAAQALDQHERKKSA